MTEIARIQDQLHRSFHGDAWHGPALGRLLADVEAARAAARPLPEAHSIWEIVLHVIAWERVVRRRIGGERVDELPTDEDWPAVDDASVGAWAAARTALESENRALQEAIGRLDDARLDGQVVGCPYSHYHLLHGAIQHDLYHAGQIALLKKGATR